MPPPRVLALIAAYAAAVAGFFAASSFASHAGAQTVGVLTIVDGTATVQRGGERFAAVEGLRVQPDDIVATGPGARLVRVELDDGKTLDLGAGTQVLLRPQAFEADELRRAPLYLGRGWAKLSAPWQLTSPAALASARLDVQRVRGVVIVNAEAGATWAYVESGVAAMQPRDGRRIAPYALAEGEAFLQRAEAGGPDTAPNARLATLPRVFTDTLPRRSARFAQAAVVPGAATPLPRDELPAWLKGERALADAWTASHAPRRSAAAGAAR